MLPLQLGRRKNTCGTVTPPPSNPAGLMAWSPNPAVPSPEEPLQPSCKRLGNKSSLPPRFYKCLLHSSSWLLQSSILSTSTESTTNTMPSVHLVYDFHSGLNFSWPPTSQKWKVTVLEFPKVTLIFSVLNPLVGTVFTNSLNCSLYNTVVFPAQSKPRMTMWKDWNEGRLDRIEVWSDSPFPISSCREVFQIEKCFLLTLLRTSLPRRSSYQTAEGENEGYSCEIMYNCSLFLLK